MKIKSRHNLIILSIILLMIFFVCVEISFVKGEFSDECDSDADCAWIGEFGQWCDQKGVINECKVKQCNLIGDERCVDTNLFVCSNFYTWIDQGEVGEKCGVPSDDGLIMRLSDTTNAHGALWDEESYSVKIYTPNGEKVDHSCVATDLYLSDTTNAHGSVEGVAGYDTNVCVNSAEIFCYTIIDNCHNPADETVVLSLSGTTNAHFAIGEGGNDYPIKYCCETVAPVCNNNGICDSGEDFTNCPADCSCNDNLRNGDEIGIDCGGSCPNNDCCTNNHQDLNLGETGIDCGGSSCQACTSVYWADMNGNQIFKADIGDSVLLVANWVGNPNDVVTFELKENDTGEGFFNDNIGGFDAIVDASGNAKVTIEIKKSDYDAWVADEVDNKAEFYFEIGGQTSGDLNVNGGVLSSDSETEIDIISPKCGFDGTVGVDVNFNINLYDLDDEILVAHVSFGDGKSQEISGGVNSLTHIYDDYGDYMVTVNSSNSRGKTQSSLTSIMVIDNSVDGTYFAACIDGPENLAKISGRNVHFNASSTRVINVIGGSRVSIPLDQLVFKWSYGDGSSCTFLNVTKNCTDALGNSHNFDFSSSYPDSVNKRGYDHKHGYGGAGLYQANLEVSL